MFVHGSMCMAYSGNCVISNYTQGRDSNRGGCAHSCRFEYSIEGEGLSKKYSHFMSSKDLNGLRNLQEFIDAGIDSLKVEGRMKSHHYAGTISKVYSEALSFYKEKGHFLSDDLNQWELELSKVSHRAYTEASLVRPAGAESIYDERQHEQSETNVGAIVLESKEDQYVLAEVRSPFYVGDTLELVRFSGPSLKVEVSKIEDITGEAFEKSRPGMLWRLPALKGAEAYNIIRVYPKASVCVGDNL